MIDPKEYIFIPKIDVSEGFSAIGAITQACLLGTKKAIYIIPFKIVSVYRYVAPVNYAVDEESPVEYMKRVLEDERTDLKELENGLTKMLQNEELRRIFPVDEMKTFKVRKGRLTGGMFLKMPSESKKAVNIPGKENKKALYDFYKEKFKG